MPIRWPAEHQPDGAAVFARNERDVAAAPEAVWAWLVRADLWPEYYSRASKVEMPDGEPELRAGTCFKWRTLGTTVTSEITEFEPAERLAWTFSIPGGRGHHAWLITPRDAGCHLLTEETQRGPLPWLGGLFMPRVMHRAHEQWVEGLGRVAEAGPPPDRAEQ